MTIENQNISNLIADQFPSFYKEEGPEFIAFVQAYFEWMEQTGNVVGDSRNLLSYRDIDTTLPSFINHFTAKYLYGIPDSIKFDKRFLIKHVLDVYRSKGTIRGYKLLFRLLYQEDITIYLPSRDVFTLSDGEWYQPQYLEVNDQPLTDTFVGQFIRGAASGATAVVDQYIRQPVANTVKHILYLTDISGQFFRGEKVIPASAIISPTLMAEAPTIGGSFTDLQIVNGGQNFKIGDTIVITNGSGIEGEALVTETANGTGTLAFTISNGGDLYSANGFSIITRNVLDGNNNIIPRTSTNTVPVGSGGSFTVGSLSQIRNLSYSTDIVVDTQNNYIAGGVANVAVLTGGNNYSNTQTSNSALPVPLVFTNRWYLSELEIGTRGSKYSNGDLITISGGGVSANGFIVTDDSGALVSADIVNQGQWDTNVAVTATITSVNGTGGTVIPTLANTGSGATGIISTDNSGHITNAIIQTSGSGYVVPPIITVDPGSTGAGATFAANVSYQYFANTVATKNLRTPFDQLFSYKTGQFGSISSLTNISTGNNYNSNPHITVADIMLSNNRPGSVYYSANSVTVTGIGTNFTNDFNVGDTIVLTINNDVDHLLHDYRIVASIANNTSLALDDNPQNTANGNIFAVYIVNGGSNYKNTDTVSVTSNTGTGASFTITTDNTGAIYNITTTNSGGGYLTAPTITVSSNTGTGANIYSTVTSSVYNIGSQIVPSSFVATVDIPDFGLRDGGGIPGENAQIGATAVFGSGIIKKILTKNSGFGYTDGELVTLATYGAITNLQILNGGSGYANGQSIVFNGGTPVTPAIGTISTDSNGTINLISIQYYGSGYKYVPSLSVISSKGQGAVLTCAIGGLNTQYNISGHVQLSGIGTLKGRWNSTKSFLSSNKYLQDSYYYQSYSYEIQSNIPFAEYEGLIKKIFHVQGTELFGRLIKTDYSPSDNGPTYSFVTSS